MHTCVCHFCMQGAQRALALDLGKWRKEREVAWKHVGELKEQV